MAVEKKEIFSYEGLTNESTKEFFQDKKNLKEILEIIEEYLRDNYDINERVFKAFLNALENSGNLENFIGFVDIIDNINIIIDSSNEGEELKLLKGVKEGLKYVIIDKIQNFNEEISSATNHGVKQAIIVLENDKN